LLGGLIVSSANAPIVDWVLSISGLSCTSMADGEVGAHGEKEASTERKEK